MVRLAKARVELAEISLDCIAFMIPGMVFGMDWGAGRWGLRTLWTIHNICMKYKYFNRKFPRHHHRHQLQCEMHKPGFIISEREAE